MNAEYKNKPSQGILLSQGIITIGRANNNDMVIDNIMISSHHAKIITFNKAAYIQDLGSTNGTYINGVKYQYQRLRPGDHVQIGEISFTIAGFD